MVSRDVRCMLKWVRPPCLTHINGTPLLLSLYRDGANDAAAHHSPLTGRRGLGMVGIGVLENVRTMDG